MEAKIVQPYKSFNFQPLGIKRRITIHNPKRVRFIVSLIAESNTNRSSSSSHDHSSEPVVYNDNWFDRLAINHLSNSFQASAGLSRVMSGYDGLVETTRMVSQRFTPTEQSELAMQTLSTAFPKPILSLIKTLLPPSRFAREYFALFTTIFFAWLVGPCEVKESEIEGRRENNVVYIPKCRLLEATNCVGICTNLCKVPSQTFIKESLGVPVNMVPNFDDMSCEMIFGQEPPPRSLDPAFTQPCYKQCKAVNRHHKICTN